MKLNCLILLLCLLPHTIWAQEAGMDYILLESKLPIVSIRTYNQEIPDEPKISAVMAILKNDSSQVNILTTSFNKYEQSIGIEIRGESSQYFYPKKSYGLETRDSLGDNLNISLLGLPKENDWILYGPYGDKTMLRNALLYTIAGKMMDWAPTMVFCELVINNAYQGVYLFGEKIKRDKNRVDIAKLVEKDTMGDDLSGGYIIRLDKGVQVPSIGWHSAISYAPTNHHKVFFQYYYPKPEQILPVQKAYIQDYINNVEQVLKSSSFNDPAIGYPSYIDSKSFIDFFILNEFSKNIDGYRLSTYLYKNKDSKNPSLKIGPVWDYNLGFGNANYCQAYHHMGWIYQQEQICPNGEWPVPFWWDRLLDDEAFRNQLKTRWIELRQGPLQLDSITNYIHEQVADLGDAIPRNFEKWPILGRWVWPNYSVKDSYHQEIDELIRWITNRVNWLDLYMPGQQINTGSEPVIHALPKIEIFPNPFSEYVSIRSSKPVNDPLLVQVYSATGQVVIQKKITSFPYQLLTQKLPAGFYYLILKEAKGKLLHQTKLMKQ